MKKTLALHACLALVAGMSINGICFAESADESVVECTHVADRNARLQCYDDRMTRLGHKIGTDTAAVSRQPSPAPVAAPTRAVAVTPTASASRAQAPAPVADAAEFGMTAHELRKKHAAEGLPDAAQRELVARVKAIGHRAHGELRIELDNEQVWVETQSPGHFTPPAVGDTVIVRHGSLGSYFLSRESGPALRVERIH
jgi:hypothetical protein